MEKILEMLLVLVFLFQTWILFCNNKVSTQTNHQHKENMEDHDNNEREDHKRKKRKRSHFTVKKLKEQGVISMEAMTYMRGRSIPNQFVFIDEVQNLTPLEVKTIITRAGEGTKIILTGDPFQIDSPYLDFGSNGLTVTMDKLKECEIFGSIYLQKSERSRVAEVAAHML